MVAQPTTPRMMCGAPVRRSQSLHSESSPHVAANAPSFCPARVLVRRWQSHVRACVERASERAREAGSNTLSASSHRYHLHT
eukprot:3349996-Rhodomonas_salina.1